MRSPRPAYLTFYNIAYFTDVMVRVRNDMMIENVEAWLRGRPINILE